MAPRSPNLKKPAGKASPQETEAMDECGEVSTHASDQDDMQWQTIKNIPVVWKRVAVVISVSIACALLLLLLCCIVLLMLRNRAKGDLGRRDGLAASSGETATQVSRLDSRSLIDSEALLPIGEYYGSELTSQMTEQRGLSRGFDSSFVRPELSCSEVHRLYPHLFALQPPLSSPYDESPDRQPAAHSAVRSWGSLDSEWHVTVPFKEEPSGISEHSGLFGDAMDKLLSMPVYTRFSTPVCTSDASTRSLAATESPREPRRGSASRSDGSPAKYKF
ncbi:hypothetical protein HPB47_007005 [Ixodes persulcatus]|uniref:Uncharacterized protein n=1 Tax=Ixodes persulcatus TaxID=34615 RepID=A0AC60P8T1_IXOPE|nr:hypothetical protein HPB47_007005 [Ixodes persulcatus]